MRSDSEDARLRELQFLARLDREGRVDLTVAVEDPDRLMILHLLRERYVNHLAALEGTSGEIPDLEDALRGRLAHDLDLLLKVEPVAFRINHKGRLRLAELEQALQTGRDRDPTGLMFSKRHLDRDLAIAVLSARPETPVSVAFVDMNGLKTINDSHGHGAGDKAITTYLQVLASICGDGIEGYRGDGGDEVVLVVRAMPKDRVASLLNAVLVKLAAEKVEGVDVVLTASCGIASTSDPAADGDALKDRADKAQYRAKEAASNAGEGKPSVIAVEDGAPEIVRISS
jgi:diguanylate cyclase (GGDEF)-like protein